MNTGLVDLESLKKERKADFCGKTAKCYIKGNMLVKIYSYYYDRDLFIPLDINNLCDFSKYSADTIAFPIEYLYKGKKIIGEILPYIKNDTILDSFNDKANIRSIIDSYELVVCDLDLFRNIDMVDLCSVNILYSNKDGFHIIDTTEWKFTDDALALNLRRFNSSLVSVIISNIGIPVTYSKYYSEIDENYYNNMSRYGSAGKLLQANMDLLMANKFRIIDLLYAYMAIYKVHYGSDMQTLKDMKEMTKVLKKG